MNNLINIHSLENYGSSFLYMYKIVNMKYSQWSKCVIRPVNETFYSNILYFLRFLTKVMKVSK